MSEKKKPLRKGRKPAEGDKRQFLLTMDPEVIKNIKLAAIEDDTSHYFGTLGFAISARRMSQ